MCMRKCAAVFEEHTQCAAILQAASAERSEYGGKTRSGGDSPPAPTDVGQKLSFLIWIIPRRAGKGKGGGAGDQRFPGFAMMRCRCESFCERGRPLLKIGRRKMRRVHAPLHVLLCVFQYAYMRSLLIYALQRPGVFFRSPHSNHEKADHSHGCGTASNGQDRPQGGGGDPLPCRLKDKVVPAAVDTQQLPS